MIIVFAKVVFSIALLPLYAIKNALRFMIPYKLRAKDISKEIILVTGAGKCFILKIKIETIKNS